jgi:protein-tyrosine phosphatase
MIAFLKRQLRVEEYGGARAWLAHLQASTADLFGAYGGQQQVDWSRVRRLVFVCKGNICRSPYAELRARSWQWESVSMGLEALAGSAADTAAIEAAARRGINLHDHRSTRFSVELIRPTDLVLGFEPWHVQAVQRQLSGTAHQCALVGLWSSPRRPDLGDPHGRGARYFDICYELIDSSVRHLVTSGQR